MNSDSFWICSSINTVIYVATFVILYLRSNHCYIMKRTPFLLYSSLIGGLVQNFLILSMMSFDSSYILLNYPHHYKTLLDFRQAGILLGHLLLIFPYLLRSYRLYFIFHLDKNWKKEDCFFRNNIHRTGQRWLLKVLVIGLVPWIICVIIIFSSKNGNFLPGCEIKSSDAQLNTSQCLYVLVCFSEQISMVFSLFLLRDVFDDYKMTRELGWVTIFCVLTPISPFFSNKNQYLHIPIIIRNLFLLGRSCILPVISSFSRTNNFEIITQEMITSCELIIQSEIGLHYFEKFLSSEKCSLKECVHNIRGAQALQLYMKCENYLILPLEEEKSSILDDIKHLGIGKTGIEGNCLIDLTKNHLLHLLKSEYFDKFMMSKQYLRLKRLVINQEIFIGRILQTSLDCIFQIGTLIGRRESDEQLKSFRNP